MSEVIQIQMFEIIQIQMFEMIQIQMLVFEMMQMQMQVSEIIQMQMHVFLTENAIKYIPVYINFYYSYIKHMPYY